MQLRVTVIISLLAGVIFMWSRVDAGRFALLSSVPVRWARVPRAPAQWTLNGQEHKRIPSTLHNLVDDLAISTGSVKGALYVKVERGVVTSFVVLKNVREELRSVARGLAVGNQLMLSLGSPVAP